MGLVGLVGHNKGRVERDNEACDFCLGLLRSHQGRGGVSGRENPRNSLHWWIPMEVEMFAQGTWVDTSFDNCVFQGARKKATTIRSDIPEIAGWKNLTCHHVHASYEFERTQVSAHVTHFPHRDEAEYTAALAWSITYAVSMCMCRLGKAPMRIPRAPKLEQGGDRTDWLDLDPRALRKWAMVPMAIAIGVDISKHTPDARGLPTRAVPPCDKGYVLKANEIYVGQGNHAHRLPTTKWASPFLVGHHGTAEECILHYLDLFRKSGLVSEVPTLMGKVLFCDIPFCQVSTADVLNAECWSQLGTHRAARAAVQKSVKRLRSGQIGRRAVLALAATGWGGISRKPCHSSSA